MPDEIDTLDTSQTSTQNFALDATAETDFNSASGSIFLDFESLADTRVNSATGSQSLAQGLANDLGNSSTSSQSRLEAIAEPFLTFQTSSQLAVEARIPIPIITITRPGIDPGAYSLSDTIQKHTIENLDQRTAIEVVSIDGSPQTVTIITNYVQEELNLEDRVVTIPAGATKFIGPFPRHIYNQGITTIYLNPSVSGTLKFRAFRLIA